MSAENLFDILDECVPGGTLDHLDRDLIPDRNLYLTRLSMDHLEDMFEYSKDDRLYRYFEYSAHKTIDDTHNYLQRLLDGVGHEKTGRKSMYWFLRLVETGKVIGTIGLVEIDINRESAGWGYAISPTYWGQGLILEAQLLVVKYFFEELKMNRLFGFTAFDNEAVLSSIMAAGFQREGVLRDYYKYPGQIRKDAIIYSLLAKEYFAAKELKLANKLGCRLSLDMIQKIAVSVLGVSNLLIDETTEMENIPQWDSLNHIAFITAIEKEIGIKFKPIEIARATSVKSLLDIVNGRS